MPTSKFWVYVKMMDVIQARESIKQLNLLAFSLGSMDKPQASQFQMNLQTAATVFATSGRRSGVIRPRTPEEMAMLSGGSVDVAMAVRNPPAGPA